MINLYRQPLPIVYYVYIGSITVDMGLFSNVIEKVKTQRHKTR